MSGVERIDLASFAVQSGWRPGFSADPRDIAKLPLGLRVRIEHRRTGSLETVVSLR